MNNIVKIRQLGATESKFSSTTIIARSLCTFFPQADYTYIVVYCCVVVVGGSTKWVA